jgi:hypothetical protein
VSDDILETARRVLEAAKEATPTSPFEWEYFITGDEGQDLKIATKFDAYHSSHEIAIILGFDETTVEEEEANAAYIVAAANAAPLLAQAVIEMREREARDWRQAASELIDIIRQYPDIASPVFVEQLQKMWVEKAEFRICSYCGFLIETIEGSSEAMLEHVKQCEKNPLVAEIARLCARIIDLEDQTGIADNIIQEMEAK